MLAHERERAEVADDLALDHGERVLDDAAVLEQLEGVVPEDDVAKDVVESGIPRVLDPAVGVIWGTLAGLALWVLLLVAGSIAARTF
jgi:hypothetical protein